MGNTLAELKARLSTLNRKTTKNNDIWKPKDEHDVRLVKSGVEELFVERAFHFNIGDARDLLCPKINFGEECVICDYAEVLRKWKDDKGRDKPEKVRKEDFEIFKKIQATSKVYVPMIERTEDGKGISSPAWWALTQNQAGQILEVCSDPDRLRECGIDPDDADNAMDAVFSPSKAFDLHVSFKKPGEKENKKTFTVIDIKPKYKPSPLTGNKAKDAELAAEVKPLKDVFERTTSTDVERAFAKWLGSGGKEAKPEGGNEYAPKTTEKAEKAGTRKVEEAFEELLGGK